MPPHPVPEDPSPGQAVARDRGQTLIEIVLAVVLMAMIVIPLLSAVQTGIKASSVNQAAATAETAIVDAADRINRAPQACDYSVFAKASVKTKGWDESLATVTQQAYDPSSNQWVAAGCLSASGPTDDLVQRVTITITTPDGKVTRSLQVVKSNV